MFAFLCWWFKTDTWTNTWIKCQDWVIVWSSAHRPFFTADTLSHRRSFPGVTDHINNVSVVSKCASVSWQCDKWVSTNNAIVQYSYLQLCSSCCHMSNCCSVKKKRKKKKRLALWRRQVEKLSCFTALSQPDRQDKRWHDVLYVSLCGHVTFLHVRLWTSCCDDTVLMLWSGSGTKTTRLGFRKQNVLATNTAANCKNTTFCWKLTGKTKKKKKIVFTHTNGECPNDLSKISSGFLLTIICCIILFSLCFVVFWLLSCCQIFRVITNVWSHFLVMRWLRSWITESRVSFLS